MKVENMKTLFSSLSMEAAAVVEDTSNDVEQGAGVLSPLRVCCFLFGSMTGGPEPSTAAEDRLVLQFRSLQSLCPSLTLSVCVSSVSAFLRASPILTVAPSHACLTTNPLTSRIDHHKPMLAAPLLLLVCHG